MADKKSDNSEILDEDQQLVKKVDEMMNVKGADLGPTQDALPNSDISSVAASINESLAQDLGSQNTPEAVPVEPPITPEPVDITPPSEAAATAPTLPGEDITINDEATEPVPEAVDNTEPVEAATENPEVEPETITETEDIPPVDPTIEDKATDKAVAEIVAKEGDTVLAVEDAKTEEFNKAIVSKESFKDKLSRIFRSKKLWVFIIVIAITLFAIPATRYKVLGLFIKKTVTISVIDSKTSTPVSNAQVQLAGVNAKTDSDGKAKVTAGLGKRELKINKKYYQTLSTTNLIGLKSSNPAPYKLDATGRLVPITVLNKVTGKPIEGVLITSKGTNAKTDAKGMASIALPTTANTYSAKLNSKGFTNADVTIIVTDKAVKENKFELTPSGQIYFLSNKSGNIDVVKANLDGSDRKTVLAGTGKEDPRTTSLLASRDWRYLVLKSKRDTAQPALYLIDTSNDKVTQFDTGDAEFTLIGWYDHSFMYSALKNNLQYFQPGKQVLKSYDAGKAQLNQLDQNQAEGSAGSTAYQSLFNFYIVNGDLVYNTEWNKDGASADAIDLSAKTDTIRGIQPNGQGKKDYKTFPTNNTNFIQATLYEPQGIYYSVFDSASKPTYYKYEDKSVKTASIDQNAIDKGYPTFLISPQGKQSFWSELRDGKNALFIGDSNAKNQKQLATLSEYSPYGWFSEDYVLVSKSGSELYISSPASLSSNKTPLKITDYYKPAQTYSGYGYGYGGL